MIAAFLLVAIGGMVAAGSAAGSGLLNGALTAGVWLKAAVWLGWIAAAACAAVAFLVSWRRGQAG
jgi:hypothetical protein